MMAIKVWKSEKHKLLEFIIIRVVCLAEQLVFVKTLNVKVDVSESILGIRFDGAWLLQHGGTQVMRVQYLIVVKALES